MNRLKKMTEQIKRLFIPHYTDKKVNAIYDEALSDLGNSGETIARYNRLLKANGVVMRIAIAAGHGEKGKK